MPISIKQLIDVVAELEASVQSLGSEFAKPTLIELKGGYRVFRHDKQNDLLLSYLKCVRAVSSLNAAVVLLEHGYVQEVGTLCRCIQDFYEDVFVLATPLGDNGPSTQQKRLVEEFFQEEFDDPDSPFRSTQSRDRVPRSKVHAGIARTPGQPVNPNDTQEVHRTVHQGFSGYVHGAYGHIMETYGGNPPMFHMHGMKDTPCIPKWTDTLANYVYRTIIAVEVVAKRSEADKVVKHIAGVRQKYETDTGFGQGDPNQTIKRLK